VRPPVPPEPVARPGAGGAGVTGVAGPWLRKAKKHLQNCQGINQRRREEGLEISQDDLYFEVEAGRYLDVVRREMEVVLTPPALGGVLAAFFAGLLVVLWFWFFITGKVGWAALSALTPVLAGLMIASILLPTLVKLKLAGFEATLQPHHPVGAIGPSGSDMFAPARFTVGAGPVGQIPKRGQPSKDIQKKPLYKLRNVAFRPSGPV
jgi:hypothetical protein